MLDFKVETFLCVCQTMNFTRAAQQLNLTQPAVSQQIHSLEEYYGVKLFHYERRQLSLTPQGVKLKTALEAMSHDTERLKAGFRQTGGGLQLHIGATRTIGGYWLPSRLAGFMAACPQTVMDVTCDDTAHILALLDAGKLDFAFVEGYFNKESYASRLVKKCAILPVCAKDYPLELVHRIEDLFCYPLLTREQGSGTRAVFSNYLREHGYGIKNFETCYTLNTPQLIRHLLLAGCGISLVYETMVADCLENHTLQEIAVPGLHLQHEYNVIWNKNSLFGEEYNHVLDTLLRER